MPDPTYDRYTPSFLDRLIDPDRTQSFKTVLLRDVEDLLNTHRPPEELFEGLEEAGKSIANFGLKDLTGFPQKSENDRKLIYKHIEEVIEHFEPRVHHVKVTPRDYDEVEKEEKEQFKRGALYLRIQAQLRGASEDIVFESILELNKGHHTVRGGGA